jgi:hypothetical protein
VVSRVGWAGGVGGGCHVRRRGILGTQFASAPCIGKYCCGVGVRDRERRAVDSCRVVVVDR